MFELIAYILKAEGKNKFKFDFRKIHRISCKC